jgi:hypothetical protein
MSLTVTEANQLNTLLDYVLATEAGLPVSIPCRGEARDAAAFLADHAHKTLLAGFTSDTVRRTWPEPRKEH